MNISKDSIRESSSSNKIDQEEEEIDQKGFLSQVFLTSFGRVVDKGSQEPYRPDMFFKLPKEISLAHCQKVASDEVKEMLKKTPLSLLSCTKLIQSYLWKELALFFLNELIHLLLPFILIEFVKWIQEDAPTSPEDRYFYRLKGYLFTFLAFVLSITKIYCQSKNIEWVAKSECYLKNILNVSEKL